MLLTASSYTCLEKTTCNATATRHCILDDRLPPSPASRSMSRKWQRGGQGTRSVPSWKTPPTLSMINCGRWRAPSATDSFNQSAIRNVSGACLCPLQSDCTVTTDQARCDLPPSFFPTIHWLIYSAYIHIVNPVVVTANNYCTLSPLCLNIYHYFCNY